MVGWLAGVDFQCRWVVESQGYGHGQGHIRRGLRTLCGLAVGGVPFVGFPLYKYVVGGVKGDCRNIFHERSVCGFLRAVLEQQFQASLVV